MSISAHEALRDLRATLDVLRDPDAPAPTLPAQDLSAVPQLIERARAAGLDAATELELDGVPIPSPVGQAGFRIVQESLTNVLRHARASHTTVRIVTVGRSLQIEVTDNGAGADREINPAPGAWPPEGRLVTCAALILAISFVSLSIQPDIVVQLISTGLAVGIILDAVVVRTLLVPALVALLGRWNWWMPGPLARILRVPPGRVEQPART